MSVIQLNTADCVYSKNQILLVTLKIRNQLQEESYVFLEVEHLFQLVGCAKKQTSVCHRSAESETISLDAGLRMDGIFAIDLWDVVIEVIHSSFNVPPTQKIFTPKCKPKGAAGNCRHKPHNTRLKKERDRNVHQLSDLDHVTTNAHSSQGKAQLYILENNEAVIKIIIKGRSPMMRHVSRTHRVA